MELSHLKDRIDALFELVVVELPPIRRKDRSNCMNHNTTDVGKPITSHCISTLTRRNLTVQVQPLLATSIQVFSSYSFDSSSLRGDLLRSAAELIL